MNNPLWYPYRGGTKANVARVVTGKSNKHDGDKGNETGRYGTDRRSPNRTASRRGRDNQTDDDNTGPYKAPNYFTDINQKGNASNFL